MHGFGRRLVFSRPKAWLGMKVEVPRLLRETRIPPSATGLDIATGLGWASATLARCVRPPETSVRSSVRISAAVADRDSGPPFADDQRDVVITKLKLTQQMAAIVEMADDGPRAVAAGQA
jgi:hypothetical protein